MPTTPFAHLLASVNSGAPADGPITAAIGDTVDLSAQSTVGWTTSGATAPRWEVNGPATFATPAGWTAGTSTGQAYFLGLVPPQFTLTVWGKFMLRLLVNGGGGQLTDEDTAITVPHASGIIDLGRGETNQFNQGWDDDHRANLRVVAAGLGIAKAPADAIYLVGAANGDLSAEVVWTAIGTTVAFASTSTVPCSFSRTDAAFNTAIDARTLIAITAGAPADGLGVSELYRASGAGVTPIDIGRLSFTWTDITGANEDSKCSLQVRTAGAALATCAEFSGTSAKLQGIATGAAGAVAIAADGTLSRTDAVAGAAKFLENDTIAQNTNGVPIQAITSTLAFTSASTQPASFTRQQATSGATLEVMSILRTTGGAGANGDGVELDLQIANAAGAPATAAAFSAEWTDVVALGGPKAKLVLKTASAGVLGERVTVSNTGALRLHALGLGVLHSDASGNVTSSNIVSGEITAPLTLTLDDATQNDVSTVLTLRHTFNGGFGVNNIGAKLAFEAEDTAGDNEDAGFITGRLTTATDGAEVSQIELWTRTGGGAAAANATLSGTGILSVTGGVRSPSLDAVAATALTLGGTNATSIACSGLGLTAVVSVANVAGALSLTAGAGDATLDADAAHDAKVGTGTAAAVLIGRTGKTVTISSGGEEHDLDDDTIVTHRWGADDFTIHRRKSVTTVNNTPVVAFTFSIPASASGFVELRVKGVDVTNNDDAYYEKRWRFSRRSGAASTFNTVGTDIDSESDATWDATVTHASPTLSATVTGDGANQTQFDVQWWVHYQTFSPV